MGSVAFLNDGGNAKEGETIAPKVRYLMQWFLYWTAGAM